MWVEKYKPKKLGDVAGNKEQLRELADSVKRGKSVLLTGPTGVGKTCSVEALSREIDADLIEMNASDIRTKDAIIEKMHHAAVQQSLFMRKKILLIDEADGLTSSGVTAVYELIKKSKFPVVVTANDAWSLPALRSACKNIELNNPTVYEIRDFLKKIAAAEGITVDDSVLKQLASIGGRDVRAAINDFEQIARGKKAVTMNDLEQLGYRDRETSIFDALKIVFKTSKIETALSAPDSVDVDPDMFMLWVEDNIAVEYERADDRANAYDAISRADVFAGRIIRRQSWELLKYQMDLATAGVALSKQEMYRKFTRYQFPTYIRMLSRSKATRSARKHVLSLVRRHCHCSTEAATEYLPLLKRIGKNIEWIDEETLGVIKKL